MANVIDEVTKQLTGLRVARKATGLTQEQLADIIGTDRANIAGMESAARSMSFKMGRRLAEHVDVGSAELVIANRLAAMKRAEDERDPAGVLKAAIDIVKLADSEELSPEGEKFIDAVADRALSFAGVGSSSKGSRYEDGEEYDAPGADGRNTRGKFVGVEKAKADHDQFQTAFSGVMGGGSERNYPPEDYVVDDGRDPITGHRLIDLSEVEEDDDE